MAVTTTNRLGVYRWSEDTDPFNRAQMDISHANLEGQAAKYTRGTTLPTSSSVWERSFFYKTDTNVLYFFVGTDVDGTWQPVGNFFGGVLADVNYAGSSSDGTSQFAARADHVHGMIDLQLENYILKATVDTKGDLIAATGNSTVSNIPAGTTGQVLTVDPSTPTGLSWKTAVTNNTTTDLVGIIVGSGSFISAIQTIDGGSA